MFTAQQQFSPSPSPGPTPSSPPYNSNANSNQSTNGSGNGPGASGGGGGGAGAYNNGGSGGGGGARYSLINKLQQQAGGQGGSPSAVNNNQQQPPPPPPPPHHHNFAQSPHHQQHLQHNSFGFSGPQQSPGGFGNHHNPHGPQLTGPLGHHPPHAPPGHLQSQAGGAGGPQGTVGQGVAGIGSPMSAPNGAPVSQHWQQQLNLAHLSRQASSPHHNARAAHLAQRGQSNAAIAITDPGNRPNSVTAAGAGKSYSSSSAATIINGHRKDASGGDDARSASVASTRTTMSSSGRDPKELASSPTATAAELLNSGSDLSNKTDKNTWTTLDMGGMALKNLSIELFRYTFLTTLYVPHNSLSTLPSSISQLVNLTLLDASSNKLTSLPVELGLLTRLQNLLLFDNHLQTLPPELGSLHQLETLGIEGNPLPDQIRSLLEKDGTSGLIAYLRDSCPVPLPPPDRDWLTIEPDTFTRPGSNTTSEPKPLEEQFSLLCYNILCEKYATAQMYGYTPSWALSWDYRKELILTEVMNYAADIVCLQEVDIEQYETFFLENLSRHEYDGVYYPKSRARTMSGEEKRHVDGCATFFKNTTFALVEQHVIEFNQIAIRRPDFKKTEDMFNRVMTKDNIAVIALLEHRKSGARLIVANAHIHWDPEFRDVKLVQVAMLMDELQKIANDFAKLPSRLNLGEGYDKAPTYSNGSKIPTIICGDFNSVPESGVYEFLSKGQVEKDHGDFMNHVYGNYTSEGLKHRLTLKSAYSHVGELEFTNFTPGFQGVIDYLFYSNSLSVTGLLGPVDPDYLKTVVGFPNAHWPSDHISLLAEFKMKNQLPA
ncbi:Glucose-repressible alcohol dehydrogenase transcriptional effector [Microbotryomycetes sp. JL221]|nr:Glucose-repressible alcohol dehydrogenase transcriptional effector [Microbotryomycetes sp. JL221]